MSAMCVHTGFRKCRSCEMMIIVELYWLSTSSSQRIELMSEVVGRFVEQQHVRLREQRLREQHAQLPARSHVAHRTVVIFNGDADAEQQFARARFGGVAVVFGELRFELGGVHVVVVGRVGVRVDRVALGHRGPHFRVAHHHDVEHAHVFIRELVLGAIYRGARSAPA